MPTQDELRATLPSYAHYLLDRPGSEPDPTPAVDPRLARLVDAAFERALASQATATAVTRHRLPDAGAVLARRRQQLASREVA